MKIEALYDNASYCIMLYSITCIGLHRSVVEWCYVMLCYVMLCYVMLCYVMVYNVMLHVCYNVMLYYVIQESGIIY